MAMTVAVTRACLHRTVETRITLVACTAAVGKAVPVVRAISRTRDSRTIFSLPSRGAHTLAINAISVARAPSNTVTLLARLSPVPDEAMT